MMFGRGSPKFLLGKDLHKRLSPKACTTKRKGASPKPCTTKRKGASPKVPEKPRASWSFGQEKDLVELFHEHNNPSFRGDNGWTSEAWNKITREMNEKHPFASFTKIQIQNKEKELKRDYRFLKEARMQSGISWDDSSKMVVAELALWDNMLISFPKVKKFRSKRACFPLFDALGEIHDGQTAEGTLNFTSSEPSQHPIITQVDNVEESAKRDNSFPDTEERVDDDDDIDNSTEQAEKEVAMEAQGTLGKRVEKEPKKRKKSDVAGMMESYIAMKTKQAEEEAAARERAKADVDEFSIKKCISVVNEMEELTTEEKVDAFDVFMNEQKREIFLSADPSSRILWLRRQLARIEISLEEQRC